MITTMTISVTIVIMINHHHDNDNNAINIMVIIHLHASQHLHHWARPHAFQMCSAPQGVKANAILQL